MVFLLFGNEFNHIPIGLIERFYLTQQITSKTFLWALKHVLQLKEISDVSRIQTLIDFNILEERISFFLYVDDCLILWEVFIMSIF